MGGSDAQIRVHFRALGLGFTQIQIGTDFGNVLTGDAIVYAGGQTGPGNNAFIGSNPEDGLYVVQPIPEPGTALLIGIGLAILGSIVHPARQSPISSSTLESVTSPSSV